MAATDHCLDRDHVVIGIMPSKANPQNDSSMARLSAISGPRPVKQCHQKSSTRDAITHKKQPRKQYQHQQKQQQLNEEKDRTAGQLFSKQGAMTGRSAPCIHRKQKPLILPKTLHEYLLTLNLTQQEARHCITMAQHYVANQTKVDSSFPEDDTSIRLERQEASLVKTADTALRWLLDAGVSAEQLPLLLLHGFPHVLSIDPIVHFQPKVDWLKQQGVSAPAIRRMAKDQAKHPWLVALSLVELQTAIQRLNHIVGKPGLDTAAAQRAPGALMMTKQQLQTAVGALASVVGSQYAAADLVARKPQLLVANVLANYTSLAAALWPYGLEGRDVQAVCGTQADLLADADAVNFAPTLECMSQLGIVGEELAEVLLAAPELLLRDTEDIRRKLNMLRRHRYNIARDILWYPQLLSHRVQTIGSRLAFMDDRQLTSPQSTDLRQLMSCREDVFSEVFCESLHEEYTVFKIQWERTYAMGVEWVSSPQPSNPVPAPRSDQQSGAASGIQPLPTKRRARRNPTLDKQKATDD